MMSTNISDSSEASNSSTTVVETSQQPDDDQTPKPTKVTLIEHETLQKVNDNAEPRLKYSRIAGLPPTVFTNDPVSAFLAGDTFFAFATHGGVIHLTRPGFTLIRSYRAHKASVLGLSTDGTYLGSASMDGLVVVMNINDEKDISGHDFQRPVHSVALDPNYKLTKAYISGGMAGDVVLSERNWLGQRTCTTVQASEDPVIAVYWLEGLIIWMNETGVNIYSQYTKKLLQNLPRPEGAPRADLYKPRICIPESNRLYIAWASNVWNLKITVTKSKEPRNIISSSASMVFSSASSMRSLAIEQTISVESLLHIPCLISGISGYKGDSIMIIAHPLPSEHENVSAAPNLRIIDLDTSKETTCDELALDGCERLSVNDYHLSQFADHTTTKYLIVSARDGLVAKERNLGDHIDWLLERRKFKDAWEFSANFKSPLERYDMGLSWVEKEVEEELWSQSVETLKLVQESFLKTDMKSDAFPLESEDIVASDTETLVMENWNKWGWILSEKGHSGTMARVLPYTPTMKCEPALYEHILKVFVDFAQTDELSLYLDKWPKRLYEMEHIKDHLEHHLRQTPSNESLRRILIGLYVASEDMVPAVKHLLALRDSSVIQIVAEYQILRPLIPELADFLTVSLAQTNDAKYTPLPILREKLAPALIVAIQAHPKVSSQSVIDELTKQGLDVVSFLYLERLQSIDPPEFQTHVDLQVRFFAEFDRPRLLSFLKKNAYNLLLAVNVCESHSYFPELVYILGQLGQNRRALEIIMEELDDCEQAIGFISASRDEDLWDVLLDYSIDHRPSYIKTLLEKAGHAIHPTKIIQSIPPEKEIPGLKSAVAKVFFDQQSTLSLYGDMLQVVKIEAQTFAETLRSLHREGTLLEFTTDELQDNSKLHNHSDYDLSQSLVLLPDGSVKTEGELVGERNVYAKGASTYASHTISDKVKHLAYIKHKLQLCIP